ncbi:MAG: ABC transporter permease [Caldisericia bacterium]|nr:ABC transporter permease [Caldisericia bacterium]MDD4613919.1 ABC transporter permease [Caldisericia bacterium]
MREGFIHELRAGISFVNRNFNLTKRYWKWEVVFLLWTIANAVSIGFIGKWTGSFSNVEVNTDYITMYMLLGSILWGYLSVVFEVVSETVSWERWEDTIEYTFMAPVKRVTHLLSVCGYAALYALLRTVFILLVLTLFFDIQLVGANYGAAFLLLVIASFSFMGLGICAAVLPLISPEKGAQMVGIFSSILLMFSGVYYDIGILPTWMQFVAKGSPATYALRGIRNTILEGSSFWTQMDNIWPLVVMSFIFIPVGVILFSKAEAWAKKNGKLKRSG